MKKYMLIHTALFAEAKSIIEHFKLQCLQTKPYRIYTKDDIVLIVSGMGKEKTSLHVKDIFEKYTIKKAINVGITGCKDKDIEIGSLFCTSHRLDFINYANLTTVDEPLNDEKNLQTTLVDMEAKSFISTCKELVSIPKSGINPALSANLRKIRAKNESIVEISKSSFKNLSSTASFLSNTSLLVSPTCLLIGSNSLLFSKSFKTSQIRLFISAAALFVKVSVSILDGFAPRYKSAI